MGSFYTSLKQINCTPLLLPQQGENPNYTIELVILGKMKKKNTSSLRFMDIWNILIAHAAFLDSGSFCKTKIAKK